MSNLTLSRPQKEAVETIEGHVMVIACPGAGKTTTLLERIHYIVQTKQVDPRSILMMTFTKAAAAEMKRRYIDRYMNGNTSLLLYHPLFMLHNFATVRRIKAGRCDQWNRSKRLLLLQSPQYALNQ